LLSPRFAEESPVSLTTDPEDPRLTHGAGSDESNLVKHARRELELCGQTTEDPEFAASLVAAVEAFASYGHSGGSAAVGADMLYQLLRCRPLAPLTSSPHEWVDRSEASGQPWWQNLRDPRAMSHDGGHTYWWVGGDGVARPTQPVEAAGASDG
jgi:hypothetical protein